MTRAHGRPSPHRAKLPGLSGGAWVPACMPEPLMTLRAVMQTLGAPRHVLRQLIRREAFPPGEVLIGRLRVWRREAVRRWQRRRACRAASRTPSNSGLTSSTGVTATSGTSGTSGTSRPSPSSDATGKRLVPVHASLDSPPGTAS